MDYHSAATSMKALESAIRTVFARRGYHWQIQNKLATRKAFASLRNGDPPMARIQIRKKDGTDTPYFWSDEDKTAKTEKTVYKATPEGVKRMRGVHFDAVAQRIVKH